ncbi:DUF6168 family protein [uncultured Polaribacter sp.]|uniref:DUF6168 family protein n=1 Tax=uncultured Polaribacter sp. TaxID=174711 RepID=UPI00262BAB07|nr:DUF6168 family protein [uncultured Polaribacter sp.]
MIKSILLFAFVFFSLFFLSFSIHQNYLQSIEVLLPFSLKKVYLFHFGYSLLICINFILLSTVDKIFEQLSFIYLVTIFLKIVLFCVIFYNPIFSEENMSFTSRISLFIPTIIFLLTEAISVAKILKKKQ